MSITIHPVSFSGNDYISKEMNPLGGELIAIVTHAGWAPACITFYAGPSESDSKTVRTPTGDLLKIENVLPESTVQVPPGFLRGHFSLTLVSGTEDEQVEQTGSQVVHLVFRS
jgi:hypothetical protein